MSLLIVSNRVSNLVEAPGGGFKPEPAAGGLAVLFEMALKPGDQWLGWNGKVTAGTPPATESQTSVGGVRYSTFAFRSGPGEKFYRNESKDPKDAGKTDFTNGTLWPLFHGMQSAPIKKNLLQAYETVNEQFAVRTKQQIAPETSGIWVQDYHLMSVGKRLRNKGVDKPLGFFLHIPFPHKEDRARLSPAVRQGLFDGLLHYDRVGFQTERDKTEFKNFAVEELGAKQDRNGNLTAHGRTVKLGVYPAGIDPQFYANMGYSTSDRTRFDQQMASKNDGAAAILEAVGQRKMLFSVERMDPSKGIKQRLTAFKDFLRENPDQADQVAMVQIGNISRQGVPAYVQYRKDVLKLAGEINAEFGKPDAPAIILSEKTFSRQQLAQLAHNMAVGLVTPLRDGMNLVAREFVEAQDPRNPAVFGVSIGAGVSKDFKAAGAVIGDSTQPGSLKAMIADCVKLTTDDHVETRRAVHKAMQAANRRDTALNWSESFRQDLVGNDNVRPLFGHVRRIGSAPSV